jgi:hypothetical protein
MFQMSDIVSINRSPDDVFNFVADLHNFPKWRANLASSTVVSERSAHVGAQCDEEIQMGLRKIPLLARSHHFPRAGHSRFKQCLPVLSTMVT